MHACDDKVYCYHFKAVYMLFYNANQLVES